MVVTGCQVLLTSPCSGTELLQDGDTIAPGVPDGGVGQRNACNYVCFLPLPTVCGVPWTSHLHPVHPYSFQDVLFDSGMRCSSMQERWDMGCVVCPCGNIGTQAAALGCVSPALSPPWLAPVAWVAVNPRAQGGGLMPSLCMHLTRGHLGWQQLTPKAILHSNPLQRLLVRWYFARDVGVQLGSLPWHCLSTSILSSYLGWVG